MPQYRVPISDTMKKNVDSIVNTDYKLGDVYNDSGIKIVKRPESAILALELTIHGRSAITGQDYSFEPYVVNKFVIEQQFSRNYTDYISAVLTLTPVQLLILLDNYRDLNCTVILKECIPKLDYVDHTNIVYENTFKVILKDKEIKKRLPKKALLSDNAMDRNIEHSSQLFDNIEVQLVPDTEYILRKKKFNFIMRDATVKDVILYLAKSCEINKVCLTEPDNTKVYQNLIIPPQQTFSTCMELLQEYYGIYNKGLSYYYTNGILYIYPAYETSPTSKEGVHFYYAGQDAIAGAELYHAYSEDNMLHVVITSTPTIKDLADSGIENFGNTIMYQHSDRIIDLYSSIGEGIGGNNSRMGLGEIDLKEPNTSIFSLKDTDFGISKDAYNIVFDHTANPYASTSDIYSYMRMMIGVQWQNAWPDSLKPGYLIHYHYDGEDIYRRTDDESQEYADNAEYMTRDGICEEVTYTIQPIQGSKLSNRQNYSCVASIILSVEYEPAPEEEQATMNTSMVTSGKSAFTQNANVSSDESSNILSKLPGVIGLFDLI